MKNLRTVDTCMNCKHCKIIGVIDDGDYYYCLKNKTIPNKVTMVEQYYATFGWTPKIKDYYEDYEDVLEHWLINCCRDRQVKPNQICDEHERQDDGNN